MQAFSSQGPLVKGETGRRHPALFLFFLLILNLASLVCAAPGSASWTRIGPNGGDIQSILIDPDDPNTLYAASRYDGVYKSTDGGASWNYTGLNRGYAQMISLAIDPQNGQILYAGTSDGTYKSTDGGASWSQLGLPASHSADFLCVDPQRPQTVYAIVFGTLYTLYKSIDGGANWSPITIVQTPNSFGALSLAIDPFDPQILYAGGRDASSTPPSCAMYKSLDGGATWQPIGSGLPTNRYNDGVQSLVVDPQHSGTLYAGTVMNGLYKSVDSGAHWSRIGLSGTPVYSIAVGPQNLQTLYAGTDTGVSRSRDGGKTWSSTPIGKGSSVRSLAIDPQDPQIVFAGTGEGVYKSTNAGAGWKVSSSGITSVLVRVLAVDPQNTATVYAGGDHGVIKSTNNGVSWSGAGLPGKRIYALAIDPLDTRILYAGVYAFSQSLGFFKTTDGGAHWTELGMAGISVGALAIDPQHPDTLYAAGDYHGIYKSTDGGTNWSQAGFSGTSIVCLAVDPQNGATLYAGTPGGLFKSTDGGASWNDAGLAGNIVRSLVIDPQNPLTLYAATDLMDGVYKSVDGGAHWSRSGATGDIIGALAIDPKDPRTLGAGGRNAIYKSTDAGISWGLASVGMPNPHGVNSLAIDPENTGTWYAATASSGFFKCTDGGGANDRDLAVTFLPDLNGNGAKELAVLRQAAGSGLKTSILIVDVGTGALVKELSCLNAQFRPITLVRIDNVDGKGNRGLAILAVREDGAGKILQVKVQLIDPGTGGLIRDILFNRTYTPNALFWVNDLNGNGSVELALLGTSPVTGRSSVQIRDSLTGAPVKSFFVTSNGAVTSVALWSLSDMNGNGSEELAILQRNTGKYGDWIKVMDLQTLEAVKTIPCLNEDSTTVPLAMAWLRDVSMNGAPELAALYPQDYGSIVAYWDTLTGQRWRFFSFGDVDDLDYWLPKGLAAADIRWSKAFELAILGTNPYSGVTHVELRDCLTGDLIKTVQFP